MKINCRLCKSDDFSLFLDLGLHPPSDQFLNRSDLQNKVEYFPLRVVKCNICSFVQLDHIVDPVILYQKDYPYISSTTKAGRLHFDSFAEKTIQKYNLKSNDFVIDIGSNVGVLLSGFKNRGIKVLGIDPASNIAKIAIESGIPTITEFFSNGIAEKVLPVHGNASVITGTNVFAHIDDLDSVIKEVDKLLSINGVFIVEAPYLKHLINNLEYDTIYHEHLSYISLLPLVNFLKVRGYEIIDLDEITIHGGSLRIHMARIGKFKPTSKVKEMINKEESDGIHDLSVLKSFANKVMKNRTDLILLVNQLKAQGKKIAGISAPAKGMTLLNYCGFNKEDLLFVTEKCKLKVGKFTPGGCIPVKNDQALVDEKIDYGILLAWNFKDEIISNLSEFRKSGGKFIIPIPEPHII